MQADPGLSEKVFRQTSVNVIYMNELKFCVISKSHALGQILDLVRRCSDKCLPTLSTYNWYNANIQQVAFS